MPKEHWGEIVVFILLNEKVLCKRPSAIASRCVTMPV
jgi:hypothetical protein